MTRTEQIDSFIPLALAHAKRRVQMEKPKRRMEIGADGLPFAWNYESQYYHEEMDRLTKADGLRV